MFMICMHVYVFTKVTVTIIRYVLALFLHFILAQSPLTCVTMCSDSRCDDDDCTLRCHMDPDSTATVIEVTLTDTSSGMTMQSNENVVRK